MLWGLFEKTIITDRIAMVVDEIYGNYTEYGLIPIVIATMLFALQIYCDFDGYTVIARGTARVLGVELMNNFKQPYFSTSIHEFWSRWHISLSSWFRDYLYIPSGGNRKGTIRKYINLMVVFLVSGLWHGAEWTFLIWGEIHGILNVVENMLHLDKRTKDSISQKIRNGIITFGLVDFAWLFFRADNITHAKGLFIQMIHQVGDFTDVLACMGQNEWNILLLALIILIGVDYLRYKGKALFQLLEMQEIWFRWSVYIGMICILVYFQIYSVTYEPSQFIYFQF